MNMKQSLWILVYPEGLPEGYTRMRRLCFIFIEGTRVYTLYTMNFAGEYRRRQILYSPVFQNYFSSNRGKYRRRQISYSPVFQNYFSSIWRKYFGYFCISLGRYNYLSLYSPCNGYIPLIQKFLQLKHIAKWMVYIFILIMNNIPRLWIFWGWVELY